MVIPGFTLTLLLNEGTNTFVYRGIRDKNQQKVIIKILSSPYSAEKLAHFRREYQLQENLQGIGTVKVCSFETANKAAAIIMEDDGSSTLKQYIANKPGGIELSQFFKIAISIIDVLEVIHSHHIIHKDINPPNILWDEANQIAKIIDFGISSILLKEDLEIRSLQKLEGTLDYISPEQTGRMNRSVDYRTDFYSLGVTFYEMLTGHLPFQEQNILKLVHCHIATEPEFVSKLHPHIPEIVSEIIKKLLAKIPEERYASAAGLREDLLQCQQQFALHKTIEPFKIGQKDIHDQLILSQKLYGREDEIMQLLSIFERTSEGEKSFLLIAGYSGIGKTTLVNEIYKPITRQSGYFISGKYDQLQRSTPYSGIIEAFQGLVRYLLTEPEDQLSLHRDELLKALGNNGQIITDVIPDIELIIGPQLPVSELTPSAAQNRFLHTFLSFIRALSQINHPLVIFLDDLQWVDSASLKLIQALLTDDQLTYFFLIGAYRENEVANDHPLMFMKEQLTKGNIITHNMKLKPLRTRDVHNFLADSLNMKRKQIAPFADLVLSKTHGNPFFINEFLRKLYHENLLSYSYREYHWRWDIPKIQQQPITDNVIDLLIARIYRLPENTQQILEYAACIGHMFDLETLSIISQKSVQEVIKSITIAIEFSFITPTHQNYQLVDLSIDFMSTFPNAKIEYRFQHDRVQQAAYQLIDDFQKQQLHLQIGRLLLKNKKPSDHDDQLFELMNHYNNSLNLITNFDEKYELAEYNFWAGKKAKGAAAFDSAKIYLEAGLSLLTELPIEKKQTIYFALCKELATCQYITGEFDKAEEGFNKLLKEVTETQTLIEVYKLHCQMLCSQLKHKDAIKLGLKALALLDVHISIEPSNFRILWSMLKIELLLWRKPVNSNEILPLMTSKRYQLVSDIIGQLMISAVIANKRLFVLLTCTNVYLSLINGYTKNTTSAGLSYLIILMRALKSHKKVMQLAEYFCHQEHHYGLAISKSRVMILLSATIDPWRFSLEECFEEFNQAYQYANEESDFFIAMLCLIFIFLNAFMIGKSVMELKTYLENTINYLNKNKMHDLLILCTLGRTILENFIDNFHDMKDQLVKTKMIILQQSTHIRLPTATGIFFVEAAKVCYFLGDYEEAKEWALESLHYKITINGIFTVTALFYSGLALLSGKNPQKSFKMINKTQKKLRRFASWSPENYNFYLWLFEAEIANVTNDIKKAMVLYNQAIQLAVKQNILPNIGLANECAARFYLKLNIIDIAKTYYLNAHHAYQHWGASALSTRLEKLHPEWFRGSKGLSMANEKKSVSIDSCASSLDVLSLLRATQVISSEIQLDVLLKKLIIVLLQNAGAHRGVLIVKEDTNTWYVAVEGTIAAQHVTLMKDKDIKERNDLPMTLIRFVQRTQEMVIAQSKADFEPFAEDPYLAEVQPQSIIVMPLQFQGQLSTIVFIENRTTSHAFTTEHVHTLQVLSAQAVISLENARLYYQATHDPLTGLANRNSLYHMYPFALGRAKRNKTSIAILFLDLDGFKKINDLLGHDIGDKFLIHFAERLKICLRDGDLAVRLGGDEFVALLEDADKTQITRIVERLIYKTDPAVIQGNTIPINVSVGISMYPDHADNISTLLKQADIALYRVKESGKGNFQFYTQNLDQQLMQENQLEKELQGAGDRGELRIYYQPVYTATRHKLTHFEALLRWQHPVLGLLEPKTFLHFAESNDLILSLGAWIFYKVFKQIKAWEISGLRVVPVAINVSTLQLKKEMLSVFLPKLLKELSLDPHLVELELTESIFIDFDQKVLDTIHTLKKLGIIFTLDDFGSHYSSLSYLARFPVDYLKIDQSFIKNIEYEKKDRELILSIIKMAHHLELRVIAEGVETKNQMLFLEENLIDELQGYYLSRPMSHENAGMLLENVLFDINIV